jgi:hypothetical protein
MIEKTTAAANLEFIQHTLAEVLAADPAQRDLVRFHVCEASECAKTLAAYLGQDAPNAAVRVGGTPYPPRAGWRKG